MTAIVAFKRNGKVFLAGDRMGSNGYTKQVVSAPKIFSVGEDLHFGYTHSFYMGQLLQHMFIPPTKDHRDTDDRHLFTKIVPALKKMFDENDFGKKKPTKVIKVGRNDPCPCGSGKKYKKCCGK